MMVSEANPEKADEKEHTPNTTKAMHPSTAVTHVGIGSQAKRTMHTNNIKRLNTAGVMAYLTNLRRDKNVE